MATLSGLEVCTDVHERIVTFCKIKLASFNIISDDYAYTHADDYANLFAKFYIAEGMDRLSMDKRIEEAKNKAFANLSDEEFSIPCED